MLSDLRTVQIIFRDLLLVGVMSASCVRGQEPEATPPPEAMPAADRDHDGIPDAADRCPDEPEDHDGFEDEDGCVDRDNDSDGIPDAHEFRGGRWTNCDFQYRRDGTIWDCRNQPEDFDGNGDLDGCPDLLYCGLEGPDTTVAFLGDGSLAAFEGATVEELSVKFHAHDGMRVLLSVKGDDCPACASRRALEVLLAELERRAIPERSVDVEPSSKRVPAARRGARPRDPRGVIEIRVWEPACFCVESCRRELVCI